jgi:ABC-type tungstate transport system substrate-binding protein
VSVVRREFGRLIALVGLALIVGGLTGVILFTVWLATGK